MLPERRIFEPIERDKLLSHSTSEAYQACVGCSRSIVRIGLIRQGEYYLMRNIAFKDLRRKKKP